MIVKRFLAGLIFVLCTAFITLASPVRADALLDTAAKKAADLVGKQLPKDQRLRLAVMPVVNDPGGTFQRYLSAAVTMNTKFEVIERAELEQLLKEQRFQLGDIVDPGSRIEPGKIQGVETVLVGKVTQAESSLGRAEVKAFLRLLDVERGRIIWEREVEATATNPLRTILLWGFGILVVLFILSRIARRRQVEKTTVLLDNDQDLRGACAREVEKAANYVAAAREKLLAQGQSESANQAGNLRGQLLQLRDEIAFAPTGHPGSTGPNAARGAVLFDNQLLMQLKPLATRGDELLNAVTSGASDAKRRMEDLDKQVLDARNFLKNSEAHIG